MENLNVVMLSGNLAKDAELRETRSGFQILQFVLVTNRVKKNEEGTWDDVPIFTECKMYGKRAAAIKEYMKKGTRAYVIGTLVQESWNDSATGSKRSKHIVEVLKIEFNSPRIQQAPAEVYTDADIPF